MTYLNSVACFQTHIKKTITENILSFWTQDKWNSCVGLELDNNHFLNSDWDVFGINFPLSHVELGYFSPTNDWLQCVKAHYFLKVEESLLPVSVIVFKNEVAYIDMDAVYQYASNNNHFNFVKHICLSMSCHLCLDDGSCLK